MCRNTVDVTDLTEVIVHTHKWNPSEFLVHLIDRFWSVFVVVFIVVCMKVFFFLSFVWTVESIMYSLYVSLSLSLSPSLPPALHHSILPPHTHDIVDLTVHRYEARTW